jgi:hypothetical protein
MKTRIEFKFLIALLIVLVITNVILFTSRVQAEDSGPKGSDVVQGSVGSAFTYQGRLTDTNGNPIPGPCDFVFMLYDAESGGSMVAPSQTKTNQSLFNGYFSVQLDFGALVFNGSERWMAVSVACPTGSAYLLLSGRVAITATPYAHSLRPGAVSEGNKTEYMFNINNNGAGDGLRASTQAAQYNYAAVYGSNSSTGSGVFGYNSGGGYGVYGQATGGGYGVYSKGNAHIDGYLSWKPRTSYISIPAAAFRPTNNTYSFENWGGSLYAKYSDLDYEYYYASVQLPHGALITGVKFYFMDLDPDFSIYCDLFQSSMNSSNNNLMASLDSESVDVPGDSSISTTNISYPVVDNWQYSYYLKWRFYGHANNFRGYGVVISYTIIEPY